ncbi:hypothetical protein HELRODRAFT_69777, partial [Helobdella robusta]|uniref:Cadherin domain-containing protein n=1 Tax=Helobdella robusta TaxID=6412 RepID=T1FZY4_HELRO
MQQPPKVIDLHYKTDEEQPANTYVGSLKRDANLDRFYSSNITSLLQYKFLKRQSNLFTLNAHTGVLKTAVKIDRETVCPVRMDVCSVKLDVAVQPIEYIKIIRVVVVIVDVNDHTPSFASPVLEFEINESTAPDSASLTNTAISKNSLSPSQLNYFDVDSEIDTSPAFNVKIKVTKKLDREVKSVYHLVVSAIDGGGKRGSVKVVVNVIDANDNIPTFERTHYEVSIKENVPIGYLVETVKATDKDDGLNAEIIYSLESGGVVTRSKSKKNIASSSVALPFQIDNKTGAVFTSGVIDFEEVIMYRLIISARDMGPDAVQVSVPLTVYIEDENDNSPEISFHTLSSRPGEAEVSENMKIGTFVAYVSVFDADHGLLSLYFYIHVFFYLYASSDAFFILKKMNNREFQILTAAVFDYEKIREFHLSFICSDNGDVPRTSSQALKVNVTDLNDNSPQFSSQKYRVSVKENNEVGKQIIQLAASDRDSNLNAVITYSLTIKEAPANSISEDAVFLINNETGLITVAASLDREKQDKYLLEVTAQDGGQPAKYDVAYVHVTVQDVNDENMKAHNRTYLHKNNLFYVSTSVQRNDVIVRVVASDLDSGENGRVTYEIISCIETDDASLKNHNQITTEVGSIFSSSNQNFTYELTILASDHGNTSLSALIILRIFVNESYTRTGHLIVKKEDVHLKVVIAFFCGLALVIFVLLF